METDSEATVERPLYAQLASRSSAEVAKLSEEIADGDETVDPVEFTELLLHDAVHERASDIHLEPYSNGMRVRFRIDGILLDAMSLPHDTGGTLQRHLKALGGLDPLPAARPASAGRTIKIGGTTVDARTSVAPCVYGEKLAIRLLDVPQQVQQIGRLGMDSASETKVRGWLERVTGTFVVCGPTGSGKTTTLYSLLHELKTTNRSVVTIEDPVEYRVEGITQMEVDRHHHLDFAEGLRASLRLDPDYLMLGEIRDAETARIAMSAAGTGRVLMTTLHSKDAVGVLTALRNWNVDDFQSASALRVVVAQRLIRTLCEDCKEISDGPDPSDREWLKNIGREAPKQIWRAVGCSQCKDLGYVGRTGVFEVWRVDGEDAELILARKDDHKMRAHLRERQHEFMVDDALRKVERGITDMRQIKHLASG
ncbi:MAG: GspE/PulE family protein [Gammaproteobacteria bacterium]